MQATRQAASGAEARAERVVRMRRCCGAGEGAAGAAARYEWVGQVGRPEGARKETQAEIRERG